MPNEELFDGIHDDHVEDISCQNICQANIVIDNIIIKNEEDLYEVLGK